MDQNINNEKLSDEELYKRLNELKNLLKPEAQNNVSKSNTSSSGSKFANFITFISMIGVFAAAGWLAYENIGLSQRIAVMEQHISNMENNLSQNVDDNRKVYVFNMDEAVQSTGIQEANQKFEDDINALDAQVKDAQEAIKGIKEDELKLKMINLTLKPLQMKRDDLLAEYSKSMQQYLEQINQALAEIATENNVPTIFINKSVAVNTNYVIDVTPQVIEKIKTKQK